jgi:hypothetical protein
VVVAVAARKDACMGATRLQLRTRAKRRADRENSSFVSDAEWNDYLNEEVAFLHNLLVMAYEDYCLSSTDISVVSGTATYSLPADFFKERGVEIVGSDFTTTLRQFRFRERNRMQTTPYRAYMDVDDSRYQILGANLRLIPTPSASCTLRLWYTPQATVLDDDADTVDFAVVSGWEAMVVVGTAIRALMKEEADVSQLAAEKAGAIEEIKRNAASRATGDVKRIVDVDMPDFDYTMGP